MCKFVYAVRSKGYYHEFASWDLLNEHFPRADRVEPETDQYAHTPKVLLAMEEAESRFKSDGKGNQTEVLDLTLSELGGGYQELEIQIEGKSGDFWSLDEYREYVTLLFERTADHLFFPSSSLENFVLGLRDFKGDTILRVGRSREQWKFLRNTGDYSILVYYMIRNQWSLDLTADSGNATAVFHNEVECHED